MLANNMLASDHLLAPKAVFLHPIHRVSLLYKRGVTEHIASTIEACIGHAFGAARRPFCSKPFVLYLLVERRETEPLARSPRG